MEPIPHPSRCWTLGRLAPAVLAGWLGLGVGLRLLPVERLGVSPIPAAERLSGRHAPFRPHVTMYTANGEGGQNALQANLPPTERRGPLRFSTDRLGYRRNPEVPEQGAPEVLVLGGDSYTYGAHLSDEETLPPALTRHTGLATYNAGRSSGKPMTLEDLDWLLERLPGQPKIAVLVHLEHHFRRPPIEGAGPTREGTLAQVVYMKWLVAHWWQVSPLSNATRRLYRTLTNDRILPNRLKDATVVRELPGGSAILFRGYELSPARNPRDHETVEATAEYLAWWRDQLAARGIATHVLLVPTRYTTYGPWLERGSAQTAVRQAADNLYYLESELAERGIPTVNALTIFRETAAEDLRTGRLPVYREDNHWNASGVERVAAALAGALAGGTPRRSPGMSAVANAAREGG
ncbi:MAG: hypothetical protein M3Q37_09110 [Gemmatimonadota bacterium]|nr:hypothetical protein [Gemmatimonadota bacterium]